MYNDNNKQTFKKLRKNTSDQHYGKWSVWH